MNWIAWDAADRMVGFANRPAGGNATVETCYLYDASGQRVKKLVRRGSAVEASVYIDGVFEHQDSNGGGGVITNGDTQWMTAGAGVLHIERPPERLVVSGGLFHGLQLWVNLPSHDKMAAPRYQDIRADKV